MPHSLPIPPMFLGIDIGKNSFDVALIKDERKPRHKVFPNTAAGHQQLLVWLDQHGKEYGKEYGKAAAKRTQSLVSGSSEDSEVVVHACHACLEATGTYGEALALALIEAGYRVSLVNPAQIKAFGQSQLMRTKTDKADAQLIARFCQMHQPPAWTPPAPELRHLQALVRRLDALLEMRQMEHNRLQSGAGSAAPSVVSSLQEHIAYLDEQIEATRRQIQEHIDPHPTLKAQKDLLVSIPGIGEATAAVLLGELLDVSGFAKASQVAAFAGLVPKIHRSGSSVCLRPRLSKVGSPRLRQALYFPAVVALRFNGPIRALGERLAAAGKCKMLIIGAAMRKLLHLVYGVLKSGKPFATDFDNREFGCQRPRRA